MARPKKRKQGERNPPGLTKLKIVEFVYNNVNGVETSIIIEHLRGEINVRESTGIRGHLKSLEKKHYIKGKHEPGLESIWVPPEDLDSIPDLMMDSSIWGSIRVEGTPVEDLGTWFEDNSNSIFRMFNTHFFTKFVRPQLIQRLCSSPPFLEEFNLLHKMNLTSVEKSKLEEETLRELFDRALSLSPTMMIHMYHPNKLVEAGLMSIQLNSKLSDLIDEMAENETQCPFIHEQMNEARNKKRSWKDTDQLPGDVITSIEGFSLASIFLGMAIDKILFPHLSEKAESFLSDQSFNETMKKYIPNPFFSIEFLKFYSTFIAVWGTFSLMKYTHPKQST